MNFKKLHFLVPGLISAIIVMIGYVYINGLPLMHMPELDQVSSVEITSNRLDINSRVFTETEDLEMALNVTNLLLYKPGKVHQPYSFTEPSIKMNFQLKDGSSVLIEADNTIVSKNGNKYHLKDDSGSIFTKVAEGLFFFDALVELEGY
ncbi:hypothetical protein JR334_03780 [Clostridia bacterium]|nr:hypothetical protein JR334_03780 [Clostridia bacterium]